MTAKIGAQKLGIRYSTFLKQVRRLRLGQLNGRTYEVSEEDLARYRELMDTTGLLTSEAVSKLMGLSADQVGRYARELGITPRPGCGRQGRYLFSPDQVELLKLAREQAIELEIERRRSEQMKLVRQRNNRKRQHDALLADRDNRDYFGNVRFYDVITVQVDPDFAEIPGGPQESRVQWVPHYAKKDLAPNDVNTAPWRVVQDWNWPSFEALKEAYDGNDWI